MTNLLNTANGRLAVIEAQRNLLRDRMSRHWQRSIVIAYEEWRTTGSPLSLEILTNELNAAHDQEIVNLANLLGVAGGLVATVQDLSYWINPDTGSDITGDGTQTSPYATLWFLDILPGVIRHAVRILITGDGYTSSAISTGRFSFEEGGFLSFIGVGAPTVLAGPYTATAAGYTTENGGAKVDVGAAIWAENQWGEKFIRYLTGDLAGTAWPIAANDLQRIYHTYSNVSPSIGDTFEIVEPSALLDIDSSHGLTINHRQSRFRESGSYVGERVSFSNLRLLIGTAVPPTSKLLSIQSPVVFSFVRIELTSTSVGISSDVNLYYPLDQTIDTLSGAGISNICYDGDPVGVQNKLCGLRIAMGDTIVLGDVIISSCVMNGVATTDAPVRLRMKRCGLQTLSAVQSTVNISNSMHVVRSAIGTLNYLEGCDYKTQSVSIITLAPWGGGASTYSVYNSTLVISAAIDTSSIIKPAYALLVGNSATSEGQWCKCKLAVDPVANNLTGTFADIHLTAGFAGYPIVQTWPAAAWGTYTDPIGFVRVMRGSV
jgi:hypothetical protein